MEHTITDSLPAREVNAHVSVDCVLLGFDDKELKVLLVRQKNLDGTDMTANYKLPGSLIFMDEDLDEAAKRVLHELTGLSQVKMTQFQAFGGIHRLANEADSVWLERFHHLKDHPTRVVTIAYLSLLRILPRHTRLDLSYEAQWTSVDHLPTLAFDHQAIIQHAVQRVRDIAKLTPTRLFELLPRKFTIAQIHHLFETIQGKRIDLRNFHKKIQTQPYIQPLDEKETGVNHRAARFFTFKKNHNIP